jgi:hypothetical protein
LNRQLKLVQESEGSSSLLLHNVVRHLAIEADFKGTQGILNQVEIVYFSLFVGPITDTKCEEDAGLILTF